MPRLTDYEKERLENIKRNQELLKNMGIFQAEVAPRKLVSRRNSETKENNKPPSKRPRKSDSFISYRGPPRKSARLAASRMDQSKSADTASDPIDFLSKPGSDQDSPVASPSKRTTLRPITPPRRPQVLEDDDAEEYDPDYRAPLPSRDSRGTLQFQDKPFFTPNLTPEEMIRLGSFGGTVFQRHNSSVLQQVLPSSDYVEFPSSWYSDLDVSTYLTSKEYRPEINKYKVRAGQTLSDWEKQGWVHSQDPRGWFQWYCRFYLGRRTKDDDRQIRRWMGVCGPTGRFRRSLVKKIAEHHAHWDNEKISPILRQTLQHWAYRLTETDYLANF